MESNMLLEELGNVDLPELRRDISDIMSINNAFDLLITCKDNNIDPTKLPPELRKTIDIGLDAGVNEVDKITQLISNFLSGDMKDTERVHTYNLLNSFSWLSRNKSIAKIILENSNTESDIAIINSALNKLNKLKEFFVNVKDKKKIKRDEITKLRFGNSLESVQEQLFNKMVATVTSLERVQVI